MERLRIDYVEIPVSDINRSKAFYHEAFGWAFTDWGDGYSSFNDGREAGGLMLTEAPTPGGLLVIMYADDLEEALARVTMAGAELVGSIISFPGGRRFRFKDPDGHELAVWTKHGGE